MAAPYGLREDEMMTDLFGGEAEEHTPSPRPKLPVKRMPRPVMPSVPPWGPVKEADAGAKVAPIEVHTKPRESEYGYKARRYKALTPIGFLATKCVFVEFLVEFEHGVAFCLYEREAAKEGEAKEKVPKELNLMWNSQPPLVRFCWKENLGVIGGPNVRFDAGDVLGVIVDCRRQGFVSIYLFGNGTFVANRSSASTDDTVFGFASTVFGWRNSLALLPPRSCPFAVDRWTPQNHSLFDEEFRKVVRTMLLINATNKKFSRDVLYYIFDQLAKSYY